MTTTTTATTTATPAAASVMTADEALALADPFTPFGFAPHRYAVICFYRCRDCGARGPVGRALLGGDFNDLPPVEQAAHTWPTDHFDTAGHEYSDRITLSRAPARTTTMRRSARRPGPPPAPDPQRGPAHPRPRPLPIPGGGPSAYPPLRPRPGLATRAPRPPPCAACRPPPHSAATPDRSDRSPGLAHPSAQGGVRAVRRTRPPLRRPRPAPSVGVAVRVLRTPLHPRHQDPVPVPGPQVLDPWREALLPPLPRPRLPPVVGAPPPTAPPRRLSAARPAPPTASCSKTCPCGRSTSSTSCATGSTSCAAGSARSAAPPTIRPCPPTRRGPAGPGATATNHRSDPGCAPPARVMSRPGPARTARAGPTASMWRPCRASPPSGRLLAVLARRPANVPPRQGAVSPGSSVGGTNDDHRHSPAPRTRITNEKHAPGNRAMKKIWVLENLIFHPRTGEEERAAAERMLDRAIAAAQENGQLTTKENGGDGVWHGYRLPDIRYGARYEEVKHLSTTEIARRIRADIKLARKVEAKLGTATGAEVALTDSLTALASMPKQIKVSVRTDYFSGGSSIDVRVYNLPEKGWGYVQETDMWGKPRWVPGRELNAILAALKEIHGAYNFDGSDPMVDYYHVNYYGQVEVDWRERP